MEESKDVHDIQQSSMRLLPIWCQMRHASCMRIIDLHQDRTETKIVAMEKATGILADEMERRLRGLNELRSEVVKDRELLVKHAEYQLAYRVLEEKVDDEKNKIEDLTKNIIRLETRYEGRITLTTVLSIFASVIAALGVIIPWLVHR